MEISQLNKDEAVNILKTMCTDNFCIEQLKTKQAIETILDLYQQEREKNNKIEKYIRSNEWAEDYEKSTCRTKILRILEEN